MYDVWRIKLNTQIKTGLHGRKSTLLFSVDWIIHWFISDSLYDMVGIIRLYSVVYSKRRAKANREEEEKMQNVLRCGS